MRQTQPVENYLEFLFGTYLLAEVPRLQLVINFTLTVRKLYQAECTCRLGIK